MPCHMLPISTTSPPHMLSRASPPKRPGAATNPTSHTFRFLVHVLLCTSQTSYVASWDLNPSSAHSSDLPSNTMLIVSSTAQLAVSWSLATSYSTRGAQNLTMSEQSLNMTMLKRGTQPQPLLTLQCLPLPLPLPLPLLHPLSSQHHLQTLNLLQITPQHHQHIQSTPFACRLGGQGLSFQCV